MTKLHELLAVEGQLKGQAETVRKDLAHTFAQKRHLFEKKVTQFEATTEGEQSRVEEQSDLQTTVRKELSWVSGIIAKALDVSYQVAEANTAARADVVLDDGRVLLTNVPATALLELEKRVKELRDLATAIPTLDPAKGFQPDPTNGDGVFQAREVIKTRTKKQNKVIVLHPPTKEHPAQVVLANEDVPVGIMRVQEWSAMLTPAAKADILARAEELERAVKKARTRANNTDVRDGTQKVGATLLGYIFG